MKRMWWVLIVCCLVAACFQTGCDHRKSLQRTFYKEVLRPFFISIDSAQWDVTKRYFMEDVAVALETGEKGRGVEAALSLVQTAPTRSLPRESKTIQVQFVEVKEDAVTVKVIIQGMLVSGEKVELITVRVPFVWEKRNKRWLVKEISRSVEKKEY